MVWIAVIGIFATGHRTTGNGVVAEGNQHRSACLNVALQRFFELRGQRAGVRKDHKREFRNIGVGGLYRGLGFECKGGVGGGFEGSPEIERTRGIAVGVDEQGRFRVGTLDGEEPVIVLRKCVRTIEANLAFRESVGCVECKELDGGASAGRDFDILRFDGFAIGDQGHFAGGSIGIEARYGGDGADLFRVEYAARSIDAFDSPVGDGLIGNRMDDEFCAVVQFEV